MTVNDAVVKAGRTYKVTMNGAQDVKVKYQVLLQSPLLPSEVPTSFPGVPAIGSAHPSRIGYYALSYDVSQPEGAAKHTLDVTVNYGPADITITDPTQQHPAEIIEEVTEWGWDDGTGDEELNFTASDATPAKPKAVLNSAGDPFDTVPTRYVPTPTFTKVIRRSEMFTDWPALLCTVNNASITIGSMVCPARTLLCTVAERKLIGEWRLPYEYTIRLRYRSKVVPAEETGAPEEIGWDCCVTDAGMREIDDTTGELKLIQRLSEETGQPSTVTAAELLDGHGHAVQRSGSTPVTPHSLIFQAYKRTAFPTWFYSEPPTPAPPDDDEEDN